MIQLKYINILRFKAADINNDGKLDKLGKFLLLSIYYKK